MLDASNYYDCYNRVNGRMLGTLYPTGEVRSEDILGFSTLIGQIKRKLIKENVLTITLHAPVSGGGLDSRRKFGTTLKRLLAGKAHEVSTKRGPRTKITTELKLKVWDERDRGFGIKKLMERNKLSRASIHKILKENPAT